MGALPKCVRAPILFLGLVVAVPVFGVDEQPGAAANVDFPTRVAKAFSRPVVLDFEETPLCDAVAFLADQTDIEFYIDERALDDVGIGVDVPVTAKFQRSPLKDALPLILRELDLVAIPRDQAVWITTPEEACEMMEVRVYDVADLIRVEGEQPAYVSEADAEPLIELIMTAVEPTDWDWVGGAGSIKGFRQTLVVRQTPQCHDEVDALLTDLRAALAGKPCRTDACEKSLERQVTADLKEVPLCDALEFLSKAADVDIALDRRSLDDIGIAPDTPVSVDLKDAPLQSVLDRIAGPLDCQTCPRGAVIVFTSEEEAECRLTNRYHRVDELLAENQEKGGSPEYDYAELYDLLYGVVAPETWDEVGGAGSISFFKGVMVVSQTPAVHAEIEELLKDLGRLLKPES